jgi:predicted aldo/keto reductase-like oxidoreductase
LRNKLENVFPDAKLKNLNKQLIDVIVKLISQSKFDHVGVSMHRHVDKLMEILIKMK